MQILLLTKNVVVEKELQKKLQEINHEIFCSERLLEIVGMAHIRDGINKMFDIIILSQTLNNDDVDHVIEKIGNYHVPLLREISEQNSKEKVHKEIVEKISRDMAKSDLREKLFNVQIYSSKQNYGMTVEEFLTKISKREKAVLTILLNNQGKVVTREELCSLIWGETVTNSNFSQLSSIIKRLKAKLQSHEMDRIDIETQWGQGYLLVEYPSFSK